jgi:hypothetical protein
MLQYYLYLVSTVILCINYSVLIIQVINAENLVQEILKHTTNNGVKKSPAL